MTCGPAIRVAILDAEGSTPRAAGAVMHVTRTQVLGTIGGGQLEWQAMHAAKDMLAKGEARNELELTLGPSLRQCCGGRVRLLLEHVERPVLDPAQEGAPHVMMFGSGHVGRAIIHVLQPLPWRITVVDPRPDLLPEPTSRLRAVHADDPLREMWAAPVGALWIVATHSHDLDLDVVDAVLRRGDFRWLGLIGSSTKRATFERRLLARGHDPASLARLTCPMGLTSICDKHPAAIAVSVAAELLSLPIPEAMDRMTTRGVPQHEVIG